MSDVLFIYRQLQKLETKLDTVIAMLQKEKIAMSKLDDQIAALTAKVAALKTVEDSAVTLITGIPAMIAKAVSDALAAGATPEQLQAITDLGAALDANAAPLAAALAQNTPAA